MVNKPFFFKWSSNLMVFILRFGRDNFQEAAKVANRQSADAVDWSKFKYVVYDVPTDTNSTYAQRYNRLGKLNRFLENEKGETNLPYLVTHLGGKTWRYIQIAEKEVCRGEEHLSKVFQDILDRGGEGVILRDPQAPFEHGRSRGFLKHKVPSPPYFFLQSNKIFQFLRNSGTQKRK